MRLTVSWLTFASTIISGIVKVELSNKSFTLSAFIAYTVFFLIGYSSDKPFLSLPSLIFLTVEYPRFNFSEIAFKDKSLYLSKSINSL